MIGISVSVENIDSVIKIIKKSETVETAKNSLLAKKWKINRANKLIKLIRSEKGGSSYTLSENQVMAILELRLQKLTTFGISEIEKEIKGETIEKDEDKKIRNEFWKCYFSFVLPFLYRLFQRALNKLLL